MKRYIAAVDSYGFLGRYWTKGDICELPDDKPCPEYFKEEESNVVNPDPVKEPNTFSGINAARNDSAPKTGFAYNPETGANKSEPKNSENEKTVEKSPAKSVKPSKKK